MKKIIFVVSIILIVFLFSSCSQNDRQQNSEIAHTYSDINEEYSSVLDLNNISNAERNDMINQLAQKQIDRAENYRLLIKEEYKTVIAEYERAGMYENINITYDDMCKSLDEYFDNLKSEYEANVEFFNNQCYALYGTGTAASQYLANKMYECAKSYADKAEVLYEELK